MSMIFVLPLDTLIYIAVYIQWDRGFAGVLSKLSIDIWGILAIQVSNLAHDNARFCIYKRNWYFRHSIYHYDSINENSNTWFIHNSGEIKINCTLLNHHIPSIGENTNVLFVHKKPWTKTQREMELYNTLVLLFCQQSSWYTYVLFGMYGIETSLHQIRRDLWENKDLLTQPEPVCAEITVGRVNFMYLKHVRNFCRYRIPIGSRLGFDQQFGYRSIW